MQEDIIGSVSEIETICTNKRRRGRPRKNVAVSKSGSCTLKVSNGVATRSKSLPGIHNSFNILSNEEDHMEC